MSFPSPPESLSALPLPMRTKSLGWLTGGTGVIGVSDAVGVSGVVVGVSEVVVGVSEVVGVSGVVGVVGVSTTGGMILLRSRGPTYGTYPALVTSFTYVEIADLSVRYSTERTNLSAFVAMSRRFGCRRSRPGSFGRRRTSVRSRGPPCQCHRSPQGTCRIQEVLRRSAG